jgi:hypothetical protein
VRCQLVAQDGQPVDLTHPRIGLRAPDIDATGGQVDVALAQRGRLADAQPGEAEGRDHGAAAARRSIKPAETFDAGPISGPAPPP